MVADGLTLVTLIVAVSLSVPPSLAVTIRVTTYEALSSGVKVKSTTVPLAYATPFFVTDRRRWKSARPDRDAAGKADGRPFGAGGGCAIDGDGGIDNVAALKALDGDVFVERGDAEGSGDDEPAGGVCGNAGGVTVAGDDAGGRDAVIAKRAVERRRHRGE